MKCLHNVELKFHFLWWLNLFCSLLYNFTTTHHLIAQSVAHKLIFSYFFLYWRHGLFSFIRCTFTWSFFIFIFTRIHVVSVLNYSRILVNLAQLQSFTETRSRSKVIKISWCWWRQKLFDRFLAKKGITGMIRRVIDFSFSPSFVIPVCRQV